MKEASEVQNNKEQLPEITSDRIQKVFDMKDEQGNEFDKDLVYFSLGNISLNEVACYTKKEPISLCYEFQRRRNNVFSAFRVRYGEGISAPMLDFSKQGAFGIKFNDIHSHIDSKDTDRLAAFTELQSFLTVYPIFEEINKQCSRFKVQLKQAILSRQVKLGKRHAKVVTFDIEDLDKKSERKYQDILTSTYNLLGPIRMKCFEQINENNNPCILSLTEFGKKYLYRSYLQQKEEYTSKNNRSIQFSDVFPGNTMNFPDVQEPSNANDITLLHVAKFGDYLTRKEVTDPVPLSKYEQLLVTLFEYVKKFRSKSEFKTISRLYRKHGWLADVYNALEDLSNKTKNKNLQFKMLRGLFADSRVTNRLIKHLYNLESAQTLHDIYEKKHQTSKQSNDTEHTDESLQKRYSRPLLPDSMYKKIEEDHNVSFHIQTRCKDWYSLAIKLARTSQRTSDIKDILGIRILFSKKGDNSLNDHEKIALYRDILSAIIEEFSSSGYKIDKTYKNQYANKGEISDPGNIKVFKDELEKNTGLGFSEKPKKTRKTGGNEGYTDIKTLINFLDPDGESIPTEIQMQEIKTVNGKVHTNEKNEAIHANLEKQKLLDYQCRERNYFTLQDYIEQVKSMLHKHHENMSKAFNTYLKLAQENDEPIYNLLLEKVTSEACIEFYFEGKKYIYDALSYKGEIHDESSNHKTCIKPQSTFSGIDFDQELIKGLTCFLLQKEIDDGRYFHYVYGHEALRDGYGKLYKSAKNEIHIPNVAISDCFDNNGTLRTNPKFVSNNYLSQLASGHLSSETFIGEVAGEIPLATGVTQILHEAKHRLVSVFNGRQDTSKKNRERESRSITMKSVPGLLNKHKQEQFSYYNRSQAA